MGKDSIEQLDPHTEDAVMASYKGLIGDLEDLLSFRSERIQRLEYIIEEKDQRILMLERCEIEMTIALKGK